MVFRVTTRQRNSAARDNALPDASRRPGRHTFDHGVGRQAGGAIPCDVQEPQIPIGAIQLIVAAGDAAGGIACQIEAGVLRRLTKLAEIGAVTIFPDQLVLGAGTAIDEHVLAGAEQRTVEKRSH